MAPAATSLLLLAATTSAFVIPPFNYEPDPTDACSTFTLQAWMDVLVQPVSFNEFYPEITDEAEEVLHYEEPEKVEDPDYNVLDSESTDEYDTEVIGELLRRRRDAHEIHPVLYHLNETDGANLSNNINTMSKESVENVNSEIRPPAMIEIRTSSNMKIRPSERKTIVLKNFHDNMMEFHLTATTLDQRECRAGYLEQEYQFRKINDCELQHRDKAGALCPKIDERNHEPEQLVHHDNVEYGNGDTHTLDEQDTILHLEVDTEYTNNPSARDTDTIDALTTGHFEISPSNQTDDDDDYDDARVETLGLAISCGDILEGWIDPQSELEFNYNTPECGCFVIRVHVGYATADGTVVFMPDANAQFQEILHCFDPNHEEDSDEFSSTTEEVNLDGIDVSNIIGFEEDKEENSHNHDEEEIHEDGSEEEEEEDKDREEEYGLTRDWQGRRREVRRGRVHHDGEDEDDDDWRRMQRSAATSGIIRRRRNPDEQELDDSSTQRRQQNQLRRQERRQAREQETEADRERRRQHRQQRRQERRDRRRNGSADQTTESSDSRSTLRQELRRGRSANRQIVRELPNKGQKTCCKRGIQHKKDVALSTDEDAELACEVVPSTVPEVAERFNVEEDLCGELYTSCCQRYDVQVWLDWRNRGRNSA